MFPMHLSVCAFAVAIGLTARTSASSIVAKGATFTLVSATSTVRRMFRNFDTTAITGGWCGCGARSGATSGSADFTVGTGISTSATMLDINGIVDTTVIA